MEQKRGVVYRLLDEFLSIFKRFLTLLSAKNFFRWHSTRIRDCFSRKNCLYLYYVGDTWMGNQKTSNSRNLDPAFHFHTKERKCSNSYLLFSFSLFLHLEVLGELRPGEHRVDLRVLLQEVLGRGQQQGHLGPPGPKEQKRQGKRHHTRCKSLLIVYPKAKSCSF